MAYQQRARRGISRQLLRAYLNIDSIVGYRLLGGHCGIIDFLIKSGIKIFGDSI